ncbi:putative phenazine biosynthesis-like protein [Lyophyllum shimeji]|uniref:Phenazine biosynthesis-like protein n=1 Tax=Lyophyllum shimeji TaxID=47721 RepID=A0A9P3PT97_LYOSH|nr:putative phenazine biosynthesis-like protein [Lyophyllum shimeji]
MTLKPRFVQLDVSTTRLLRNPLAIVHLPNGIELPLAQKQCIAAEFNLSEPVFLHENSNPNVPVTINIFPAAEEPPFAGHYFKCGTREGAMKSLH